MHSRPSHTRHHLIGLKLELQLELLDFFRVSDLFASSLSSVNVFAAVMSTIAHFLFLVI